MYLPVKMSGFLSDKRKERMERKKRKIKAFLDIAKLNDEDKFKAGEGCSMVGAEVPSQEKASSTATSPYIWKKTKQITPINDEELTNLRAKLRARQKAAMEKAKLYYSLDWVILHCEVCETEAVKPEHVADRRDNPLLPPLQYYQPLFPVDLQHLLLYAIQLNLASYKPRWCKLLRPSKVSQVVILEMVGLTKQTFLASQHCLSTIKQLKFDLCVELVSPCQYGSTFLQDMLDVPVSRNKLRKGRLSAAPIYDRREGLDPTENIQESAIVCDCVRLLLSPRMMVLEGYPLPIDLDRCHDFVYTKETYGEVTPKSPLFALDCEMCLTTNKQLELTRIAVVDENIETVYETLVKPYNPITDYLTKYSGITKRMLAPVSIRLEHVQEKLQQILPSDAVLCGQSLCGDLRAIKMFHPYVIDTSVIYNFTGIRQMKPGLKRLAATFLGKTIQGSTLGHSPIEDAQATMELVKLKMQQGVSFGDAVLGGSMVVGGKQADSNPQCSVPDPTGVNCKSKSQTSRSDLKEPSQKRTKVENLHDRDDDEPQPKKIKIEHSQELNGETNNIDMNQENSSLPNQPPANVIGTPDQNSVSNQQKLFFRSHETQKKQSLFDLAAESGKKVSLIGPESSINSWRQAPGAESVNFTATDCNDLCLKTCQSVLEGNDFLVWAQISEETEKDDIKLPDQMKEMDRMVEEISTKCKPDTLFIVLLAGRPVPVSHSNAVCLVTIT